VPGSSAPDPPAGRTPAESPGEPGNVRWAALLLAGAALAIFVVGSGVGLVAIGRHGGGPVQPWDDAAGRWYLHHRWSFVGASKVIAAAFDAPVLGVVCLVLTAVLAATLRTTRALIPAVAYLGAEFQVSAIRVVIHRHRPVTADAPAPGSVPGVHETAYSFPSGHTVAVTAILFGLLGCIALARRTWWPWVVALAGSVVVADSRLVLGVHWTSDVVVGLLLGAAWGVAVALAADRVGWSDLRAALHPRRGRAPEHPPTVPHDP
jgi:membrane-associated phospholipid phosphatase